MTRHHGELSSRRSVRTDLEIDQRRGIGSVAIDIFFVRESVHHEVSRFTPFKVDVCSRPAENIIVGHCRRIVSKCGIFSRCDRLDLSISKEGSPRIVLRNAFSSWRIALARQQARITPCIEVSRQVSSIHESWEPNWATNRGASHRSIGRLIEPSPLSVVDIRRIVCQAGSGKKCRELAIVSRYYNDRQKILNARPIVNNHRGERQRSGHRRVEFVCPPQDVIDIRRV